MKKITISFCMILFSFVVDAACVDTVIIFSNGMHRPIKAVVITPAAYNNLTPEHFPVVYLLHGYSGNYSNWITKVPELKEWADADKLIVVCPDGGYSSWYFDSPVDSTSKYESYETIDVVNYIDKKYRTKADKNYRAITGLSMGGHGALFLALRHPDIFGAAGSMSGGVDLNESTNRFDIIKRLGDTISNAKNWHDYSVVNLIENYANTPIKIILDCGVKDIFIKGNRLLHQKMLDLKIPHDYIERPGEHNWDYWKNAVGFQLYFFKKFFDNR